MKVDRLENRNCVDVLSLVSTIRATKFKVKTTTATLLTYIGVGRGKARLDVESKFFYTKLLDKHKISKS